MYLPLVTIFFFYVSFFSQASTSQERNQYLPLFTQSFQILYIVMIRLFPQLQPSNIDKQRLPHKMVVTVKQTGPRDTLKIPQGIGFVFSRKHKWL